MCRAAAGQVGSLSPVQAGQPSSKDSTVQCSAGQDRAVLCNGAYSDLDSLTASSGGLCWLTWFCEASVCRVLHYSVECAVKGGAVCSKGRRSVK